MWAYFPPLCFCLRYKRAGVVRQGRLRGGTIQWIGHAVGMVLLGGMLGAGHSAWSGEVKRAGPENYIAALRGLQPGDTLKLRGGVYHDTLPIHHLHGTANAPIVIEGASNGTATVLRARPGRNTVSLLNAAYIVIRDLTIDGSGLGMDGVKAEGHGDYAHHITLERLNIYRLGGGQQTVGISSKCPAWAWVIRGNTIVGAGTGMYLGGSAGSAPFVDGLIESNVVVDTLGYNLQIKHQVDRRAIPRLPRTPAQTVIRYNTFAKGHNSSGPPLARPNVLLGHFPRSGPGSDDRYLVYGNFFYQNPTERLLQAEGNVAVYDNLFVNTVGDGIAIQPHNDIPRRIWIFHNTVLARGGGILLNAAPDTEVQEVVSNVVFAADPLTGGHQRSNVAGSQSEAAQVLMQTSGTAPLDLRPMSSRVEVGDAVPFAGQFMDSDCDFEGRLRDRPAAGAYLVNGSGSGWQMTTETAPPTRSCGR